MGSSYLQTFIVVLKNKESCSWRIDLKGLKMVSITSMIWWTSSPMNPWEEKLWRPNIKISTVQNKYVYSSQKNNQIAFCLKMSQKNQKD